MLNSAALALVGIGADTPDPVEGVIERDASGEPTGLLLEMDAYLDGRIPRRPRGEFEAGVREAAERLAAMGVTTVVDATPSNSVERWETFRELRAGSVPLPRITMMAGYDHLDGFVEEGMGYGYGDDTLRLGHVKIVVTATTGALHPQPEELIGDGVAGARGGFPSGGARGGGRGGGGDGAGHRGGAPGAADRVRGPDRALLGVPAGGVASGEACWGGRLYAAGVCALPG